MIQTEMVEAQTQSQWEDGDREIGALLHLFFLDFISRKVQYREA